MRDIEGEVKEWQTGTVGKSMGTCNTAQKC